MCIVSVYIYAYIAHGNYKMENIVVHTQFMDSNRSQGYWKIVKNKKKSEV